MSDVEWCVDCGVVCARPHAEVARRRGPPRRSHPPGGWLNAGAEGLTARDLISVTQLIQRGALTLTSSHKCKLGEFRRVHSLWRDLGTWRVGTRWDPGDNNLNLNLNLGVAKNHAE